MAVCRPLVFLRHGSTEWTDKNILMGQQDVPLNDQGRQQIEATVEDLKFLRFSMIVHSPLQRCTESVAIVNRRLQIPSFLHEGLSEAAMGSLEGKPKAQGSSFDVWKHAEGSLGGETYHDFQRRVVSSIGDIFTISHQGLVLVVAHGGVFEALRDWLNMPPVYLTCATPLLIVPNNEMIVLHRQDMMRMRSSEVYS